MLDSPTNAAGDRHAELREAMDEVGRAIERIDDPLEGARTECATLFTQEGVIGVGATDGGDDLGLGSPIDIGHEVVPTLARDFERIEAIETTYDDFGRTACRAYRDVE